MTTEFRLATSVWLGRDAADRLSRFARSRVFVITDEFLSQSQLLRTVLQHLGSETTVFKDVVPDPGLAAVKAGMSAYCEARPDVVIALGGGSVMDAAKVIHKTARENGLGARYGLIAIPTTSGSGSEMTTVAVITDERHQTKIPLSAPDMAADIAILDPAMVDDLPPVVTADSGLDVVTHAVEALVATGANDFSDALAEKSLELAFKHLPACFKGGIVPEAREHMHNASGMAALAFESAGLGITHSLAHAIGGHFPISHGRLNAMLISHVIRFNAEHNSRAAERYASLGRKFAPSAHGTAGLTELVARIERLKSSLRIPADVVEAGVSVERYRKAIRDMAETAHVDGCTETNPVKPSIEDLRILLHKLA